MIFLRGDLPAAEAMIRKGIALSPNYVQSNLVLGFILLARGEREGALKAVMAESVDGGRDEGLAIVYHALGRRADSDAALARYIHDFSEVSPEGAAEAYAYRGERDKAFEWLQKAYAARDPELIWFRETPFLRPLHSDPRWQVLLRKMNLPD